MKYKQNILLQKIVIGLGFFLLLVKFTAYFITNSNAILSDALESIINIMAGVFALYGLYLTAKPKDLNHPYGHGKIEYLASGFEGALILVAGLGIIYKAIYNFYYPEEIQKLDVGLYLTIIGGVVNAGLGWMLLVNGKKNKSLILEAGGKHLLSDALTSLGLVIGIVVLLVSELDWIDNVLAIIFGVVIIVTGIKVLRKAVAGIMDEADFDLLAQLLNILNEQRKPEWIDIHNLRVIKYGDIIHVDCHVTMPYYFSLTESHDEVEAIESIAGSLENTPVEFFIHTDPCTSSQCGICQVKQCEKRALDFVERTEWTIENSFENHRHQ